MVRETAKKVLTVSSGWSKEEMVMPLGEENIQKMLTKSGIIHVMKKVGRSSGRLGIWQRERSGKGKGLQ